MNEAKHRFFCADLKAGFLDEEESKHAVRVLRLKTGDKIQVMNGAGSLCTAVITGDHKSKLSFEVERCNDQSQPAYHIHLAVAPTKNLDRFTFLIEKATEIGVSRITPIITQNSERRDVKADKLRKNLIAAIKQSGNLFLPLIDEPTTFQSFIKSDVHSDSRRFIAHCQQDTQKNELKLFVPPDKKVVILIGPEGDFTPEEVILAKQNNYQAVSLGESRLRTETAAIVACHTIHVI